MIQLGLLEPHVLIPGNAGFPIGLDVLGCVPVAEKPVVVYESPKLNQYFVVEIPEVVGVDDVEEPDPGGLEPGLVLVVELVNLVLLVVAAVPGMH